MDLHCEEEMLTDSECGTPLITSLKESNKRSLLMCNGDDLFKFYEDEMPLASVDPALVNDDRVLENMLKLEERLMPSTNSFKLIQSEVTPEMRQSVATWMWEVCEEEQVPESVFLRAINYMDRFLSVQKIERTQFQLLGAACMLISSKWAGSVLSTNRLIYYTANSISQDLLLEWELMILTMFKWEMFTIVPTDFMDHLLYRLPQSLQSAPNIRETARTYTAFCATDSNFCTNTPSMIAASTIAAAIGQRVSPDLLNDVLHMLHVITKIETGRLQQTTKRLMEWNS